MADLLPSAELEFRILLLPPISRGTHLDGPALHARRLVELWKVEGNDDIPLVQAFRLLEAPTVEGAIWRALYMGDSDEPDSGTSWQFPSLEELLPELRQLSWQAMLDGTLAVEAIKGVRGKWRRSVLPAELPRLAPDWELSRLCLDKRDEFIDVRVRRPPAEPVKKSWRNLPSQKELNGAMDEIAGDYPQGARPSFKEVWGKLKERWPDFPRDPARKAIKDYAPQLRVRRGYHPSTKSSRT